MSGSPKYTHATLSAARQAELEATRRRRAEEEERRRRQEEARARALQLEAQRAAVRERLATARARLEKEHPLLYDSDFKRLKERLERVEADLPSIAGELNARALREGIETILGDMTAAIARKRAEDEQRRVQEALARLRLGLGEIGRQLEQMQPDSSRFDPAGRVRVGEAMRKVSEVLDRRDTSGASGGLEQATLLLETHRDRVRAGRIAWAKARAEGEEALGRLTAVLAGLRNDSVVTQWESASLEELARKLGQLEEALARDEFEKVIRGVAGFRQDEAAVMARAGAAQAKADQRDYIANAMARVLQNMHFQVSTPRLEHAGHPASAMLIQASSASGKAMGISVPIEGEVWYEVEGFQKGHVSRPGGMHAAVCDEAEGVLEEFHQLLEQTWGVRTDGLRWDGRDPERRLRAADLLPSSTGVKARGGSR